VLTAPRSEAGLYVWVFCLMAAYVLIRYAFNFARKKLLDPGPAVFDAGTFAISVMLLWGVLDP